MNGAAMPPAVAGGTLPALSIGAGKQRSASTANSISLVSVTERLDSYISQPGRQNATEFFHLCLSLSRVIDYAVANNEVPPKVQDLPPLLNKVCRHQNDLLSQAAIMVLMFSVKSACKIGWFSAQESQELLVLANEIGTGFLSPGDINTGPSNLVSTVSTIMMRFYPLMKMGHILASLEVEPGYGAYMIDFHITKSLTLSPQEKIRLFVAQTDKIETSACIISPQQVNFLLNGKGVERRTNTFMDPGPLLPTHVSGMLKYGTNLLQAVGQFNGNYIIVVAFMSMASSLDNPVLQDYVQSGTTVQDSDSDVIEGPSRISLNCPISYTRIKTPVKGRSCKHLRCFDFRNYVEINSRRPSWRCPNCNQHVCYSDICVDQNIVKVLREVGENVADVIIAADGSWKAVLESNDNVDHAHDKVVSCEKKGLEQQEYAGVKNSDPVVLDLTNDDDDMDAVSISEIEDRKPNLQSQPVATNLTSSSELNSTVAINQNVVNTEDDFWSGFFYPNGSAFSSARSDAQTVGSIPERTSANCTASPILTDVISPTLNGEAQVLGYTNLTASVMQTPYSTPNSLQSQQTQILNPIVNHEYGRLSSVSRYVNRNPIAVQALPAPCQTSSPQQRSGTNMNYLTSDGSALPSNGFSDMERQQQFSRSHLSTLLGPDMGSSSLQHHTAAQVVGLQGSRVLPGACMVSSGLPTENQNLLHQQALNLRMRPSRSQSPSTIQSSSPLSRHPAKQGSAQVGRGHTAGNGSSQRARFVASAAPRAVRSATQMSRELQTVPVSFPVQGSSASPRHPMTADGVRASIGVQGVNIGGLMQTISRDNLMDLPSEQNWQPTGRMRGSLSGRAYADALSQFMIKPTQSAQPASSQSNTASHLSRVPLHLQAFLGNNSRSSHAQLQTNPTNKPANINGGSGILRERSLGMH